ncbi:hypothetical protein F4808DRAFT_368511 [Astrocystis sublimbata]|nr:hypothetical protein F4808DRAFT_368511 [Astrocystis sublimbata]
MKFQVANALTGLCFAATATAQDIYQYGPFALRVKGQAKNSSINGYVFPLKVGVVAEMPLKYEPLSSPPMGNSSFEFYFNYTGGSVEDNSIGWFISDHLAPSNKDATFLGKATSLRYNSVGSNVGQPLVGAGSTTSVGFDKDNKTFVREYVNDSTFVPGRTPDMSDSQDLYGWAVCWTNFLFWYGQSLNWITNGSPHNPTCERVDLIKEALPSSETASYPSYA